MKEALKIAENQSAVLLAQECGFDVVVEDGEIILYKTIPYADAPVRCVCHAGVTDAEVIKINNRTKQHSIDLCVEYAARTVARLNKAFSILYRDMGEPAATARVAKRVAELEG